MQQMICVQLPVIGAGIYAFNMWVFFEEKTVTLRLQIDYK